MNSRHNLTLKFILTGAIAAFPVFVFVLCGYTLEWSDTIRLFAPLRKEAVEALWELRLPLWNAYEGLGMPLFAQMIHGVLHPVNLGAALVMPHASLDLLIAINVGLAAAGAALLAYWLGASQAGTAVAGFAYALSGYVLSMSANLQYMVCAATAPWTVAFLVVASHRGGVWIPVGALAVAALWFGGDPQWAIIGVALGGVFAIVTAGWRGLLCAGGAAILGTVLAAVQLIPAWELLDNTMRSFKLVEEERMQWALPLWRLIEFVAPGFFSGRPGIELVSPVFRALGGDRQWFFVPFIASVHVGVISLVLGALGIRRKRKAAVLGVAAILFLWLALGMSLGADQLFRHLPIWGAFRYPEKLVGPFTLCVAVLAGLGTDRGVDFAKRWKPVAITSMVLMAGAGLLWLTEGSWLPWMPIPLDAANVAREHLSIGLFFTSIEVGLFAIILGFAFWKPSFKTQLPMLLVGLVFVGLVAAAPFALHLGTPGLIDTTTLKQRLPSDEFVRLVHPLQVMGGDGPASLDKSERLQLLEARMGRPSYNVVGHLDAYGVYTGLMPRRYTEINAGLDYVFGEWRVQAIRRFGCSHVILPPRWHPSMNNAVQIAIEGGAQLGTPDSSGIQIWAVPHRPWTFFARQVTDATTEEEARRLLIKSLLERRDDVVVEGITHGPRTAGRILSVRKEAESLAIEGESDGTGLLVLNDAWWPGWTATIDGQPVSIRRADALVRAVEWPPGRHILVMRYDPPELWWGLIVSTAGLLAIAALLVLPMYRAVAGNGEGKSPA